MQGGQSQQTTHNSSISWNHPKTYWIFSICTLRYIQGTSLWWFAVFFVYSYSSCWLDGWSYSYLLFLKKSLISRSTKHIIIGGFHRTTTRCHWCILICVTSLLGGLLSLHHVFQSTISKISSKVLYLFFYSLKQEATG